MAVPFLKNKQHAEPSQPLSIHITKQTTRKAARNQNETAVARGIQCPHVHFRTRLARLKRARETDRQTDRQTDRERHSVIQRARENDSMKEQTLLLEGSQKVVK